MWVQTLTTYQYYSPKYSELAVMLARSRESRKSMRRWMRREAEVILEPHKSPIGCVIHDISNDGARLSFNAPLRDLPRSFTLVLFKDSVQRHCEMVWNEWLFHRRQIRFRVVRRQIIRTRFCLQKEVQGEPRKSESNA